MASVSIIGDGLLHRCNGHSIGLGSQSATGFETCSATFEIPFNEIQEDVSTFYFVPSALQFTPRFARPVVA